MLENLILLAVYVIEAVKYCLGVKIVFQERKQTIWIYGIGGVVSMFYLLLFREQSEFLVIYFIVVLFTYLSMAGKRKDRCIELFILVLLIVSIDEIVSGITRTFLPSAILSSDKSFFRSFMDGCWGSIVMSTIYLCKNKIGKKVKLSENLVYVIIFLNGLSMIFTISGLNFAKEYVSDNNFRIFTAVLVTVAYFCMSLLCWLLVFMKNLNERAERLLRMEKQLNVDRSVHFQREMKKEEETRRFRHDINNHMIYLTALAEARDIDGIRNYLSQINRQLEDITKALYITGNDLIDVILNEKLLNLREKVRITIKGKILRPLKISDVDLCTIFANLLDNAVEAVGDVPCGEAYIEIIFRVGKVYFECEIRNSKRNKVFFSKNGMPKTSKDDSRNHGFGIENVKNAVERNHGELNISVGEKEFRVCINLKV